MGRLVGDTVGAATQFTDYECLPVALHFYHSEIISAFFEHYNLFNAHTKKQRFSPLNKSFKLS